MDMIYLSASECKLLNYRPSVTRRHIVAEDISGVTLQRLAIYHSVVMHEVSLLLLGSNKSCSEVMHRVLHTSSGTCNREGSMFGSFYSVQHLGEVMFIVTLT